MAANFSQLNEHPDAEEIISKILSGESPKAIQQWLKLKYPGNDENHLRLSLKLIKDFASSPYVDLQEQFKKDLAKIELNPLDREVSASLKNNKFYKERLTELAGNEIDIRKMLAGLISVVHNRAEQVFDVMQENPGDFKGDYVFLKYISELFNSVEKLERILNTGPAAADNHNITIQVIQQYILAFQDGLRAAVAQVLDTDTAMKFMDVFYNTMKDVEIEQGIPQEERLKEAKILHEKFTDA
jgi:hypothetical protein